MPRPYEKIRNNNEYLKDRFFVWGPTGTAENRFSATRYPSPGSSSDFQR